MTTLVRVPLATAFVFAAAAKTLHFSASANAVWLPGRWGRSPRMKRAVVALALVAEFGTVLIVMAAPGQAVVTVVAPFILALTFYGWTAIGRTGGCGCSKVGPTSRSQLLARNAALFALSLAAYPTMGLFSRSELASSGLLLGFAPLLTLILVVSSAPLLKAASMVLAPVSSVFDRRTRDRSVGTG